MDLTNKLRAVAFAGILGVVVATNTGCVEYVIERGQQEQNSPNVKSTENKYPPVPSGYIKFGTEGKNYIRDPQNGVAYELNLSTEHWDSISGYRVFNDSETGVVQFRIMGKNDLTRDLNGNGIINPLTEMRSKETYSQSETPIEVNFIFDNAPAQKTFRMNIKSYQTGNIFSENIRPDLYPAQGWNSKVQLPPGDYKAYIDNPWTQKFVGGIDFKVTP